MTAPGPHSNVIDRFVDSRFKLLLLAVVGCCLAAVFPQHIALLILVVVALVFDECAGDSAWRALAWAILGSVIAYLCLVLAYNLRLTVIGGWWDRTGLSEAAHATSVFGAIFCPLLAVARLYTFRSRRMLFVNVLSLAIGCLSYMSPGWSTDPTHRLWMKYSTLVGFSTGAVVGSVFVAVYELWAGQSEHEKSN